MASTEVEATSLETMEAGHDTLARACFAGRPAFSCRRRGNGCQPVAYGCKPCDPNRLEHQLLAGPGSVYPHRVLPPPNAHSSTNRRMRTRMSGGVRGRMGNPSSLLDRARLPGRNSRRRANFAMQLQGFARQAYVSLEGRVSYDDAGHSAMPSVEPRGLASLPIPRAPGPTARGTSSGAPAYLPSLCSVV